MGRIFCRKCLKKAIFSFQRIQVPKIFAVDECHTRIREILIYPQVNITTCMFFVYEATRLNQILKQVL